MNLLADSPHWLIWGLALLLIAAAVEDAVRLRISNLISAAIVVLAIVAAAVVGFEASLWQNFVLFAAMLVIGTLLFATGKFGGGDVKLFAATALWVDFEGALRFLAAVLIAGGVVTILTILGRVVAPQHWGERVVVLRKRGGIPYGVAIALGTLFVILTLRL